MWGDRDRDTGGTEDIRHCKVSVVQTVLKSLNFILKETL